MQLSMLCPLLTTYKTQVGRQTSFCYGNPWRWNKATITWPQWIGRHALGIQPYTLCQSKGSPFTKEPLGHLLQYDSLTSFSDCITWGRPIGTLHNFDEPMMTILENLHCKTPADMEQPTLDYDKLLEGIKKWPEHTTTSPSGQHLGIYKMLGKHIVQTKKKNDQQTDTTEIMGPPPEAGTWHLVLSVWHHGHHAQTCLSTTTMVTGLDNIHWKRTWQPWTWMLMLYHDLQSWLATPSEMALLLQFSTKDWACQNSRLQTRRGKERPQHDQSSYSMNCGNRNHPSESATYHWFVSGS